MGCPPLLLVLTVLHHTNLLCRSLSHQGMLALVQCLIVCPATAVMHAHVRQLLLLPYRRQAAALSQLIIHPWYSAQAGEHSLLCDLDHVCPCSLCMLYASNHSITRPRCCYSPQISQRLVPQSSAATAAAAFSTLHHHDPTAHPTAAAAAVACRAVSGCYCCC